MSLIIYSYRFREEENNKRQKLCISRSVQKLYYIHKTLLKKNPGGGNAESDSTRIFQGNKNGRRKACIRRYETMKERDEDKKYINIFLWHFKEDKMKV